VRERERARARERRGEKDEQENFLFKKVACTIFPEDVWLFCSQCVFSHIT